MEVEQPVVKQSEQRKHQPPLYDLCVNLHPGFAFLHLVFQRKRPGYPRNEKEQRKNSVVMFQSRPLCVIHLVANKSPDIRVREQRGQGCDERSPAHDENHIEASQCVKRF